MLPSMPRRPALLLLPLALLAASGCGERVRSTPIFPPSADVAALQEAKPVPTDDIVTDARAEARYNAAVESWGDRVSAAGVRVCRWFNANGAKFDCRGD